MAADGGCSRRRFLADGARAALGTAAALGLGTEAEAGRYPASRHEARYYTKLPDGRVQCTLCPCSPICSKELLTERRLSHACNGGLLVEGQTCVCLVRTNLGGRLYVSNYGRAGTLVAEPIEKNPLHHFRPGLRALAVSAPGCSLACKGCQNWELALAPTDEVRTVDAPPARVVSLAVQEGCRAIAFTHSEPMMFYEYMTDVARSARERGLLTTVVTGGYVNPEPVRELCSVVDAFTVSVKALDEASYASYARGRLSTVLETMRVVRACGRWLEVVFLMVPTVSDDLGRLQPLLRQLRSELGAETPVHFLRYWPSYKLKNLPQTPVRRLEQARELALAEGLPFAYVGNLPGHSGANTACPRCGTTLIRRVGFTLAEDRTRDGRCPSCRHQLPGVWSRA